MPSPRRPAVQPVIEQARVLAEFDERIVIERTMVVYRELLYGFAS